MKKASLVVGFLLVLGWAHPVVAIPAPPNDDFRDAIWLKGRTGKVTGTLKGSTVQGLEDFQQGGHTVWYRWRTPVDMTVLFDTLDSAVPTLLTLYRGEKLVSLKSFARGSDGHVSLGLRRGQKVWIRVEHGPDYGVPFTLRWGPAPAPPNDNVAYATKIVGASGAIDGTNEGASQQVGEPPVDHPEEVHPPTSTIWYRWRPPSDQPVWMYLSRRDSDNILFVYKRHNGGALTQVAATPPLANLEAPALVQFAAKQGTEYLIGLGGISGSPSPVTLAWAPERIEPPNDDFTDAKVLSGSEGSVEGTTILATEEADEPGPEVEASVWYQWTAPQSGLTSFDNLGVGVQSGELHVWKGSTLASLDRSDIYSDMWTQRATFEAVAGTTYSIRVGAYPYADAADDFDLHWSQAPPSNDDFANAALIENTAGYFGGYYDWQTTNARATSEPDEPDHNGSPAEASVWYKWKAPVTSPMTIEAFATIPGGQFAVYEGDTLGSLTEVASAASTQSVTFDAEAGVVYRIVFNGSAHPAMVGQVWFRWEQQEDLTPPWGYVSIWGTACCTEGSTLTPSPRVLLDFYASDNPWGAKLVRISNAPPSGGVLDPADTRPDSLEEPWSLAALAYGGSGTNGVRTVYAQWGDSSGNWSDVDSDSIILDTGKPSVEGPTVEVEGGCEAGKKRLTVAWGGNDSLSGISGFELQKQVGAGEFKRVDLVWATNTHLSKCFSKGKTYRFRVRARDGAGNWSGWQFSSSAAI